MPRKRKEYEVVCPYCGNVAVRVTGKEIYPHRPDLEERSFYLCKPCDAYVGTHKGTYRPLGRMANAELRKAKIAAHSKFDLLWKSGQFDRTGAYAFMAKKLGLSMTECHIGMFDVAMNKRVEQVVDQYFNLSGMPVEDA